MYKHKTCIINDIVTFNITLNSQISHMDKQQVKLSSHKISSQFRLLGEKTIKLIIVVSAMICTRPLTVVIVSLLTINSITKVYSLCVDSNMESDSKECVRNQSSVCCQSLSFLILSLSSMEDIYSIHIQILEKVEVDSIIRIKSFENLTIQGYDKSIILQCDTTSGNTGIYFEKVIGLTLLDLAIKNCSMLQNSSTPGFSDSMTNQLTWCAVYIVDTTNLRLEGIAIGHSNGTGLIMYNTKGTVVIQNSTFENNKLSNDTEYPGGGGVKIEFTYCTNNETCRIQVANTTYLIQDSVFTGNYVFEIEQIDSYFNNGSYKGFGRGGGVFFVMRGRTRGNNITITNCKFVDNYASSWGGGAYLSLRDNPSNNIILISNSDFINNECESAGGGGIQVSLLTEGVLASNAITFKDCNFIANHAKHGGGVSLVSTRERKVKNAKTQLNNSIVFENCTWYRNQAFLGSAVDISPATWDVLGNGILPVTQFCNCTMEGNCVTEKTEHVHRGIVQTTSGVGTLSVTSFVISFTGYMNFIGNYGSGIYLQSGIMTINTKTELTFKDNRAKKGGAMAMYGFSVLYASSNTMITFINNTAAITGGAIYAKSIDQHEKFSSRSCFVQTDNQNWNSTNQKVYIHFEGNTANSNAGNSIYASSLQPCVRRCKLSTMNLTSLFKCIANISGLYQKDITTNFNKFEYKNENTHTRLNKLIPGIGFKIPIQAYDELQEPLDLVYDVSLKNSSSSIRFDDSASFTGYVSNTSLRLHSQGKTEENTLLLNNDQVTIYVDVRAIECPPGHTIHNMYNICSCKFKGIWKCNSTRKVAYIINGRWIGLCSDKQQCTGTCPVGFCMDNAFAYLNVSVNETFRVLCTKNRKGKLCSECTANHTVYYHSYYFTCGSNSLCEYGILFYVLSEILPLTIIFIVIIMLNVSFTTGAVNGFILYTQIFNTFIIKVYNIVNYPKYLEKLTEMYRSVYTITNLNYFTTEKLSFCLWKGATTLDIMAWKYVTIIYALFLIIVTIFLLGTTTCKKLCVCWRPHNLKNAVIHGFVAFLVMCYSECAKVSFLLLANTDLIGYNYTHSESVVLFSGNHKLFDSVHIKYGLTALFFMLVIVILPPILLILYPLSFKILALCHLSELKLVNRLANLIPIQLFDSFQSCYKDNFRFFSGLYFVYRTVPLLLYAINADMISYYTSVEIFLIIALAFNAVLQPYKQHRHNVIDSLIFTNLAIINAISLYNYQKINEGRDNLTDVTKILTATTAIQLVLIYLPLFYIIFCCHWYGLKWLRKKIKERKIRKMDYSKQTLLDSTYLPPLRGRESITESFVDHQFHELK